MGKLRWRNRMRAVFSWDWYKLAVTTDGSGANKLVGKAVAAAGAGVTLVRVRMSQ